MATLLGQHALARSGQGAQVRALTLHRGDFQKALSMTRKLVASVLAGTLLCLGILGFAWVQIGGDDDPPDWLLGAASPGPLFAGSLESPAEREEYTVIRGQLQQRISPEFLKVELSTAICELERQLDVPIILDPEGLEEAGVRKDQLVDVWYHELCGVQVLRLLLEPLNLSYTIRDGVVQITSEEKACEQVNTRIYNVRDLLTSSWARKPDPPLPAQQGDPAAASTGCFGTGLAYLPTRAQTKWEAAAEELLDLITSTIEPDCWIDNGGTGSITSYRGMLVVSQSEEVHEDVDALLEQLRRVEASRPGEMWVVP